MTRVQAFSSSSSYQNSSSRSGSISSTSSLDSSQTPPSIILSKPSKPTAVTISKTQPDRRGRLSFGSIILTPGNLKHRPPPLPPKLPCTSTAVAVRKRVIRRQPSSTPSTGSSYANSTATATDSDEEDEQGVVVPSRRISRTVSAPQPYNNHGDSLVRPPRKQSTREWTEFQDSSDDETVMTTEIPFGSRSRPFQSIIPTPTTSSIQFPRFPTRLAPFSTQTKSIITSVPDLSPIVIPVPAISPSETLPVPIVTEPPKNKRRPLLNKTYCHYDKITTDRPKMRCASCHNLFCQNCLNRHFAHLLLITPFEDGRDLLGVCPECAGNCPCARCRRTNGMQKPEFAKKKRSGRSHQRREEKDGHSTDGSTASVVSMKSSRRIGASSASTSISTYSREVALLRKDQMRSLTTKEKKRRLAMGVSLQMEDEVDDYECTPWYSADDLLAQKARARGSSASTSDEEEDEETNEEEDEEEESQSYFGFDKINFATTLFESEQQDESLKRNRNVGTVWHEGPNRKRRRTLGLGRSNDIHASDPFEDIEIETSFDDHPFLTEALQMPFTHVPHIYKSDLSSSNLPRGVPPRPLRPSFSLAAVPFPKLSHPNRPAIASTVAPSDLSAPLPSLPAQEEEGGANDTTNDYDWCSPFKSTAAFYASRSSSPVGALSSASHFISSSSVQITSALSQYRSAANGGKSLEPMFVIESFVPTYEGRYIYKADKRYRMPGERDERNLVSREEEERAVGMMMERETVFEEIAAARGLEAGVVTW